MEIIFLGASLICAVAGYRQPVYHGESRWRTAIGWAFIPLGLVVLGLIVLSIIGDPLNFLSNGRY